MATIADVSFRRPQPLVAVTALLVAGLLACGPERRPADAVAELEGAFVRPAPRILHGQAGETRGGPWGSGGRGGGAPERVGAEYHVGLVRSYCLDELPPELGGVLKLAIRVAQIDNLFDAKHTGCFCLLLLSNCRQLL